MATPTATTYTMDGTLLEACSCLAPCPCWIGDDPDGGSCDTIIAYHIDNGQVRGVDVSDRSLVLVGHVPGNILAGNWRMVLYVDDRATPEQTQALSDVFFGKLGGAPAEFAKLIGEIVATYPAPIEHKVVDGHGTIRIGDAVYSEMEPYRDMAGNPTTLHESIFSTIPGAPAYVSKSTVTKVNIPDAGFNWEFGKRNAIQGSFHFEA